MRRHPAAVHSTSVARFAGLALIPTALLVGACGGATPAAEAPQTSHDAASESPHPTTLPTDSMPTETHDETERPGPPPGHAPGQHGHGRSHDHHGQGMTHDFSDAARWAQIFDNPERDAWQMPAHVVEVLAVQPGMVVADIGAGTGYFLPALRGAVGETGTVLAIDIEASLIQWMDDRIAQAGWDNVHTRLTPPDAPGLTSQEADRVLIVNVWHHISDRTAWAAQLADGLKPGGYVDVVDFTMDARRGPPAQHRLTPDQIQADLAAAGLHTEVLDEDLPDQFIVRGTRID